MFIYFSHNFTNFLHLKTRELSALLLWFVVAWKMLQSFTLISFIYLQKLRQTLLKTCAICLKTKHFLPYKRLLLILHFSQRYGWCFHIYFIKEIQKVLLDINRIRWYSCGRSRTRYSYRVIQSKFRDFMIAFDHDIWTKLQK